MSPSAEEIRQQLARLLASAMFGSSSRLSRFLRFVVDQTLAGNGERLKEYVIGIEVFDRDAQFDPRLDSIVRVEAGRLRAKLEQYYGSEGRGDAVVISMQKGRYAPSFTHRSPAPPSQTDDGASTALSTVRRPGPTSRRRSAIVAAACVVVAALLAVWAIQYTDRSHIVRVAVLPFESAATEADVVRARQLTERVTAELVRAGAFNVVSSTSARSVADSHARLRDVARELNADLLLEGRVFTESGRLVVEARLVDSGPEQKFWVDSFKGEASNLEELARRVAAAAVAAVNARRS